MRRESSLTTGNESQQVLPATPKRPKDLSAIFDAISPSTSSRNPSNPSTPGKAKKMLSRSRTESSIDDSPSRKNELFQKSQSFTVAPTATASSSNLAGPSVSPLKRSASQTGGSQSQSESQPEIRRSAAARASRTYAGASRSFLVQIPTTALNSQPGQDGMIGGSQNDEDIGEYRASYAELRKRYGIDNSEVGR